MAKPFSPFVHELLDLLAGFGEVSARRMFGGYGIYRDGIIIGLVDDDVAYFKVDEMNREEFERAGQKPFTIIYKGKTETMGYFTVPEGSLDSPSRLRPWAQLGWEAALRAAERKAAKKPRTAARKPAAKPAQRKSGPR